MEEEAVGLFNSLASDEEKNFWVSTRERYPSKHHTSPRGKEPSSHSEEESILDTVQKETPTLSATVAADNALGTSIDKIKI